MKPTRSRLLALLICLASPAPVLSAPPLVTDDAGVLDRGLCEIEGITQRATTAGARDTESLLQLACGVGLGSQLAVNVASARSEGERSRGAALLGKTSLWSSEQQASLALGWRLGWAREPAAGWRHAATDLSLVYSRPVFADTTLHANLGHARDRLGDSRRTTWGVALEHAGFGGLAPMAEWFGDDREAPWWNVGLRYALVEERMFINGSYGRQVADGRTRLWTLGFKFSF